MRLRSFLSPLPRARHLSAWWLLIALGLSGCAALRQPTGIAEVMDRPAERSLLSGLRLYDDAQYAEAEAALQEALKLKLVSARDQANAHKTLAFIYCTSKRLAECEGAFRAARSADPQFALGKAEAGHPLWGPVYRRTLP